MDGHRIVSALDAPQVRQLLALYQQEWWSSGRDLAGVRRMLAGTPVVVGVVEEASDELVGFARVVTDGIYCSMLFDVIVRADRRGRGLGDALMAAVLRHPDLEHAQSITLQCRDDVIPFYRRWGFEVLAAVPPTHGQGAGARMVRRVSPAR